jgi:hypothetical protein
MYLTALSVRFLGDTILAVRLVSALVGTATVLALYVVLRRSFGAPTALAGSILLALMGWHIHYTRVALPLASWPLFTVLAAGALVEAARRRDWRWYALAGLAAGAGIYVYNAHPLFLAIVALFVALDLALRLAPRLVRHRQLHLRGELLCLIALAVALGVSAVPMALYASDSGNRYSSHFDKVSVLKTGEWKSLRSPSEKARFVATRYKQYWDRVCCHPRPDGTDGIGITPIVPLSLLLLAGLGAVIGLARGQPLAYLGVLIVLLMPLAPVFTHVDGGTRRTFAMAPFLAMFPAIPVAAVFRLSYVRGRRLGMAARLALAGALILVVGYQNLSNYFVTFAHSGRQRWVYAQELTDASRYMSALPAGSHVYLYSDRWSANYETRRFLAPHVSAEDRSDRSGGPGLGVDRAKGAPVFVFLGKYKALIEPARALFPGGTVTYGPTADITWKDTARGPTFVAYRLPPAAPPGPISRAYLSSRAMSSAKRTSESSSGSYPITSRAFVMLQNLRALFDTP